MLEKIAKWLTRKPKLVAMMAVLMLIPAAIGYISTRINYDILSYLPEDLESSHGEKLLEEPFKMAATSMLVVESMPAGYTNSLLNDIKAIDGVSNAIWISNLMGIQIPTDMIPANFRDMFFAGDATMMIIQYSHPGASDETMEAIEQVRRACNEKCFLAGFSVVIKDTRDLMDSELPIFVGLAVLLALVAMMVTLESTGKKIVEKDVPTRSTTEENKKGEETGSVTSSSQDEATVYEKTQNGAETPYVVSEEYPAVRGVLVIAEGGGNPVTIKEIQEAVMALFQVGANKIKVVKMK